MLRKEREEEISEIEVVFVVMEKEFEFFDKVKGKIQKRSIVNEWEELLNLKRKRFLDFKRENECGGFLGEVYFLQFFDVFLGEDVEGLFLMNMQRGKVV